MSISWISTCAKKIFEKQLVLNESIADFQICSKSAHSQGCLHQNFNKKIAYLFDDLLIFLRENKEVSFLLFWIFKLKQPFSTRTISDYGWILRFQFSTVKSAILSLDWAKYLNRHSSKSICVIKLSFDHSYTFWSMPI